MQKKENILSKNNGAYNLLWQDREKERTVGAEAGKSGQDQPSGPSSHTKECGFCSTGNGSTWEFSGEKLHKINI